MAEFQVVARHWKRMCERYWTVTSCHGCPIAEHEGAYEACSAYETDVVKMEELVMAWAAEHPEPVYPTWIDWLRDVGVIPTQEEASRSMRDGVRAASFYVTAKAFSQIPADIAKRLEIKPKEDV